MTRAVSTPSTETRQDDAERSLCPDCDGAGWFYAVDDVERAEEVDCPTCGGRGTVPTFDRCDCADCLRGEARS